MSTMQEEEPEKYEAHFSGYVAAEVEGDDLEDLYKEAHSKIRENPKAQPTKKADSYKRFSAKKRTLSQRKDRIRQKIATAIKKKGAAEDEGGDDDDDDEEDEE